MFKQLTAVVLFLFVGAVNAATFTSLGYTFDDTNQNTLEGLINEKLGGVIDGPGALDVITANSVTLFDIDGSNPGNVDATVSGFVDTNDGGNTWFEVVSPSRMEFVVDVDQEGSPSVVDGLSYSERILMTGTLSLTSPGNYVFDLDGGTLFDGVSGFRFTSALLTLTGSGGEGDTFSMTMTASPVPLPASILLMGSALVGLFTIRRKA